MSSRCYSEVDAEVLEKCGKQHAPVDCLLGSWSYWTVCSTTCGLGYRERNRHIAREPAYGGATCQGHLKEVQPCNRLKCPEGDVKDCTFGAWSYWSVCDQNTGQKKRSRHVTKNNILGAACEGPIFEMSRCPRLSCSLSKHYCVWAEWSSWTECSATCGAGEQLRRRSLEVADALPTTELASDEKSIVFPVDEFENMSTRRMQDVAIAFLCGFASLLVALGVGRFVFARSHNAS